MNLVIPGFDPTALQIVSTPAGLVQTLSAADLYALVSQLQPSTNVTWIWRGVTAPDVITYPIFAEFIWLEPVSNAWKIYNGTSWVPIPVAAQSINGAAIINNTLPVTAFLFPSGNENRFLRINPTGDGLVYVDIIDIIAPGALPVNKLQPGAEGAVLSVLAGSVGWRTLDLSFLLNIITEKSFPINRLAPSPTNGQVAKTIGGVVVWASDDADPIAVAPEDSGKFLSNNGTTKYWATPPTAPALTLGSIPAGSNFDILQTIGGVVTWRTLNQVTGRAVSGLLSPVDGLTFAHGLGARPIEVNAYLVCKVSFGPFTAGQSIIPLHSVIRFGTTVVGGNVISRQIVAYADATTCILHMGNFDYYFSRGVDLGSPGIPLSTNWDIQFVANL